MYFSLSAAAAVAIPDIPGESIHLTYDASGSALEHAVCTRRVHSVRKKGCSKPQLLCFLWQNILTTVF